MSWLKWRRVYKSTPSLSPAPHTPAFRSSFIPSTELRTLQDIKAEYYQQSEALRLSPGRTGGYGEEEDELRDDHSYTEDGGRAELPTPSVHAEQLPTPCTTTSPEPDADWPPQVHDGSRGDVLGTRLHLITQPHMACPSDAGQLDNADPVAGPSKSAAQRQGQTRSLSVLVPPPPVTSTTPTTTYPHLDTGQSFHLRPLSSGLSVTIPTTPGNSGASPSEVGSSDRQRFLVAFGNALSSFNFSHEAGSVSEDDEADGDVTRLVKEQNERFMHLTAVMKTQAVSPLRPLNKQLTLNLDM